MTRYLVLSDLHLADIEEHDDGWKAHKARRHTYDDALAETIARFVDDGDGDDDGRAARDERRALARAHRWKRMLEEGIYVIGFSYPVVPKGEARIRVQLSAQHTPEQVDRAIDAFTRVGREMGVV